MKNLLSLAVDANASRNLNGKLSGSFFAGLFFISFVALAENALAETDSRIVPTYKVTFEEKMRSENNVLAVQWDAASPLEQAMLIKIFQQEKRMFFQERDGSFVSLDSSPESLHSFFAQLHNEYPALDLPAAHRQIDEAFAARESDSYSPFDGTVVDILVQPGQQVEAGTPLISIDMMKMHILLKASVSGHVTEILVEKEQSVFEGKRLLGIKPF